MRIFLKSSNIFSVAQLIQLVYILRHFHQPASKIIINNKTCKTCNNNSNSLTSRSTTSLVNLFLIITSCGSRIFFICIPTKCGCRDTIFPNCLKALLWASYPRSTRLLSWNWCIISRRFKNMTDHFMFCNGIVNLSSYVENGIMKSDTFM